MRARRAGPACARSPAQRTVSCTRRRPGVVGHERERLEQGGAALLQLPASRRGGGRGSSSPRRSSGGAVSGSSRSAAPNQRAALAGRAMAAPRRPRSGAASGLGSPGAPVLDVVGACGRRGAARGRARRPRSCAPRRQPPGAARRRRSHERVAEAEAARHLGARARGRAQQLVERVERRASSAAAAAAGELGLERVAGDGRALQQRAAPLADSSASSSASAAATARGTSRRRAPGRRRRARGAALAGARELLEVERVAAALGVEPVGGRAVDAARPAARRRPRARARRARGAPAPPAAARARARLTRRAALARARGQGEQHAPRRAAAAAGRRAARPRRVRPVHVVEHQHERLRRRQPLEQLAHRPVRAVALVGARRDAAHAVRERRAGRCASSARTSGVEPVEPARVEPATYSSSASTKTQNGRSDSSSDALPGQHGAPARVGARRQLGEQARLADPGLADDDQCRGSPAPGSPARSTASRSPRRVRRGGRATVQVASPRASISRGIGSRTN